MGGGGGGCARVNKRRSRRLQSADRPARSTHVARRPTDCSEKYLDTKTY